MREIIESVGIDVGTSTTQLIFSRLTIENLAGDFSIPKITIVDKEITYRSGIHTTPLLSETEIDAGRVSDIILDEFRRAGKTPQDIQTGAVIITGETARKKNANALLASLSTTAGKFVVATAGPELESVLSGRGAGADRLSEETRSVVANLDIGGGTTNISLFEKGVLRATACLDIGGRLIKTENGRLTYVYHKIQHLAAEMGIPLRVGDPVDIRLLELVCCLMADQLAQALHLKEAAPSHQVYYTNDGHPLPPAPAVEAVTFSGGVADFVYAPTDRNPFCFQDIGVLLGRAVANHPAFRRIRILPAKETIRATVIGAGNHTTEVSGSTISYRTGRLPMRNVPIVRVEPGEEGSGSAILQALRRLIPMHFPEGRPEQVALALSGEGWSSFQKIQELADCLCEGAKQLLDSALPLVVLLEQDIGKALGNALRYRLGERREIICLDGISAKNGDYIDIGVPIANGRVIPVVIKTLILNS